MSNLSVCILVWVFAFGLPDQRAYGQVPTSQVIQSELILQAQPFKQCHASTLTELNDHSILVAFFGGSYEGAPDVCIWAVHQTADQWSQPIRLADGRVSDTVAFPCWNPVLFNSKSGKIYLFYKVGKNPREWFGMMKSSDNQGLTWTQPVHLPDGILGPIKNKPVERSDGQILCPSSTETNTEWKVQMEIFDPKNHSWVARPVDPSSSFQVIQPTLLAYNDSTFRILCRSKSDSIITALTRDYGINWSPLCALNLPNPNSGIDAVTLTNGSHLLVYNPLTSGKEWVNGRNRLNLAWSADGLQWTDIFVLEDAPSGEYSYPAIIQSTDQLIHIVYTYNRSQIKYWKIRLQ